MCHVIIFCPLSVQINYAFSSPLISLTYLVATFLIFLIKILHTSVILGLWCVVGINFFPLMHLKYMEYTCNLDLQFFSTKITTIKLMCLEYMVQMPRCLSMICGSCNVPPPRGRARLPLAALQDIDCPHRPTHVFSAHFVLTHAHPGITSRSVTHPQIAPGQARLTSEFFGDRLPEKKWQLVGMSILLILLSPGRGVTAMSSCTKEAYSGR